MPNSFAAVRINKEDWISHIDFQILTLDEFIHGSNKEEEIKEWREEIEEWKRRGGILSGLSSAAVRINKEDWISHIDFQILTLDEFIHGSNKEEEIKEWREKIEEWKRRRTVVNSL